MVLQVPRRGELLPTVLLLADEGLLSVVGPHVDLQPLQHVEALPAAFSAAPEHAVVPETAQRSRFSPDCVETLTLNVTGGGAPVRFEVVLEVGRPGERPAAALERAAQDLLAQREAGTRRRLLLVPVCQQTVRVVA